MHKLAALCLCLALCLSAAACSSNPKPNAAQNAVTQARLAGFAACDALTHGNSAKVPNVLATSAELAALLGHGATYSGLVSAVLDRLGGDARERAYLNEAVAVALPYVADANAPIVKDSQTAAILSAAFAGCNDGAAVNAAP